ncbi:L-serine ammonia-lyase [Kwoniella heveanensis CBS 569]|nr:L-serine ammonia-lyase [Kwoniella heveanensis CBS 569]
MTVTPIDVFPPSPPASEQGLKEEAIPVTQNAPNTKPWIETPLVESPVLSKLAGCRIFLKLENLQPSRSFKSRGIGNLVLKAVRSTPSPEIPRTFYAPSGGNAGLACVVAATSLGQRSIIVVPETTPQKMIDKLYTNGAERVVQVGKNIAEADRYLKEHLLAYDPLGVYVPPFDHPDIWQGAESLVDELDHQLGVTSEQGGQGVDAMDAIVCSVGGGGLLIGICQGLERIQSGRRQPKGKRVSVDPTMPPSPPVETVEDGFEDSMSSTKPLVIGVETHGCESFNLSVTSRSLVTLPGITSIATSLGCITVAQRALHYGLQDHVRSTLVTDREACEACIRFVDDERILVEPACGATLALIYSGRLSEVMDVSREKKVVLIVCGGSNVDLSALQKYRDIYGK